jgi:hypothetical protein
VSEDRHAPQSGADESHTDARQVKGVSMVEAVSPPPARLSAHWLPGAQHVKVPLSPDPSVEQHVSPVWQQSSLLGFVQSAGSSEQHSAQDSGGKGRLHVPLSSRHSKPLSQRRTTLHESPITRVKRHWRALGEQYPPSPHSLLCVHGISVNRCAWDTHKHTAKYSRVQEGGMVY